MKNIVTVLIFFALSTASFAGDSTSFGVHGVSIGSTLDSSESGSPTKVLSTGSWRLYNGQAKVVPKGVYITKSTHSRQGLELLVRARCWWGCYYYYSWRGNANSTGGGTIASDGVRTRYVNRSGSTQYVYWHKLQ